MSDPKRPRASIFFFDGWISIAVSVMGAATELRARGYDVDIYFNTPPNSVISADLPTGITLHECRPWTRFAMSRIMNYFRRRTLEHLTKIRTDDRVRKRSVRLRGWAKAVAGFIEIPQFALYCRRNVKSTSLAIAFDMNSLMAMDFALPRFVPFIYWSLEIWRLADLQDPFQRRLKLHELKRLPQARAVVVQSAVRRAIIEEDLRAPLDNYVEVPNAPSHPMPASLRTDFYNSRFPIPDESWVVLHSGFISTSLMSLEIAQTVSTWPEDFVLIFHERQKRDRSEPYIKAVQKAGGRRTYLSLDPVPFEEVDNVYTGADIGLVCYQTTEANEATAWASSGKLVYYLRHAMPIIIVMPECPPLLREWDCGVWVSDVTSIGAALVKITADYEGYSTRARAAYEALFDFNGAFRRLAQAAGI